jgi:hypothetical protein
MAEDNRGRAGLNEGSKDASRMDLDAAGVDFERCAAGVQAAASATAAAGAAGGRHPQRDRAQRATHGDKIVSLQGRPPFA